MATLREGHQALSGTPIPLRDRLPARWRNNSSRCCHASKAPAGLLGTKELLEFLRPVHFHRLRSKRGTNQPDRQESILALDVQRTHSTSGLHSVSVATLDWGCFASRSSNNRIPITAIRVEVRLIKDYI